MPPDRSAARASLSTPGAAAGAVADAHAETAAEAVPVPSLNAPASPPMRRLGISAQLGLAFSLLAGVTVVVVLLVFVAGVLAQRQIALTRGVRGPAALASTLAQSSLLRMQLHLRGYLVLGDPLDRTQFQLARGQFETQLATLKRLSEHWPEAQAVRWLSEAQAIYEQGAQVPERLFDLHDDPLANRPALRLARLDLQAQRVAVLNELESLAAALAAAPGAAPSAWRADLVKFQTSFDAMVTHLMAYAAAGELNFKVAYGPQLATNSALWSELMERRALLPPALRGGLDRIELKRGEIIELALKIFTIVSGERAHEDQYLYRTQVAPQTERLVQLLAQLTDLHQSALQTALEDANALITRASIETAAGGLLAIVIAVFLGLRLRRRIIGPVTRLSAVAQRVAVGELDLRATVEADDEIGALAGNVNRMTAQLARNIGELRAAIEEAQRARAGAESASRAKSTFLANMSHELRTPLNGVLGYAQLLQLDPALTAAQRKAVDTMRQSGEHLLALINDLLDLARIEAGRNELVLRSADLHEALRRAADIIAVKAQEKGLRFEFELDPELPRWVLADAQRLGQVLLNLLGNAVKFTAHGMVRLSVDRLATQGDRARLRFAVQDSGAGIDAMPLRRLFQPFEQAPEVQQQFGGTGLGLSISQQLVTMMGGHIEVESQPGVGSRFWFDIELPVLPAPQARGSAEAAE